MELGRPISTEQVAAQLGIANRHERLLARLLEILEEDGILARAGADWAFKRIPQADKLDDRCRALLARYPACETELTLTARCAEQLPEVLTGEVDPLQLLFPAGSRAQLERLYREAPPDPRTQRPRPVGFSFAPRRAARRSQDQCPGNWRGHRWDDCAGTP